MDWFILKCGEILTNECNYIKVGKEPNCCGNQSICAIRACVDQHGRPILREELKDEMIWALVHGKETQHVRLRAY